jgi:hypothetical protein
MLPEARIEPRTPRERVRVAVSRTTRRFVTTLAALGYGTVVLIKMICIVAVPILLVILAARAGTSPRPRYEPPKINFTWQHDEARTRELWQRLEADLREINQSRQQLQQPLIRQQLPTAK